MNIQQQYISNNNQQHIINDNLNSSGLNQGNVILANPNGGTIMASQANMTGAGGNFYVIQQPQQQQQQQQIMQQTGGQSYILTSNSNATTATNNTAVQFVNSNSNGIYQTHPQSVQMTALKQPYQQQVQFINQQPQQIQQQPQQQQQLNNIKYITTNGSPSMVAVAQSPRYLIQQAQQPTQQPQQQQQQQQQFLLAQPNQTILSSNNAGGQQVFLNINNRMMPVQQASVGTVGSPVASPSMLAYQKPIQQQQQTHLVQSPQQQTAQRLQFISQTPNQQMVANVDNTINSQTMQQSYVLVANSNGTTNNNTSIADYNEKFKQLEQVQQQLRAFQAKILAGNDPNKQAMNMASLNTSSTIILTQQQINSALTQPEQAQLQKLVLQKKNLESEIQTLRQKLSTTNSSVAGKQQPLQQQQQQQPIQSQATKLQLLQQVTLKLNTLKQSKTQVNEATGQQQLVMTQEEFEQMKRLMELQSRLANECKAESAATNSTSTTASTLTTNSTVINTTTNQNTTDQLRQQLQEKYKLNEAVRQQIEQTKQTFSAQGNVAEHQATYLALVKRQAELQGQISQLEKQLGVSGTSSGTNLTGQVTATPGPQKILISMQPGTPTSTTSGQIIMNGNASGPYAINNQNMSPSIAAIPVNSAANIATASTAMLVSGNKQTPVKIRNVFSNLNATPTSAAVTVNASPSVIGTAQATPLRTLVLNSKDTNVLAGTSPSIVMVAGNSAANNAALVNSNITTSTTTAVAASNALNVPSVPHTAAYAAQLHKQHFAHVNFKCLSFEELAMHSVITKATDDLTIVLLKQLDERASTVINQEQREAFTKNQVRLVKKYLEQQQAAKALIRTRMNDQLSKDQRMVLESEYKQPFLDKTEAIKRLSRYHVLQKTFHEPGGEEAQKCNLNEKWPITCFNILDEIFLLFLVDECFEQVSERLLKIADAMKKRFHLHQLRSMQVRIIECLVKSLLIIYLMLFTTQKRNKWPRRKRPCFSSCTSKT
jgi:hypothetical protein